MGFSGDGVFLLTLAFLMKDSITSVAPVLATALLLALRWLVEITTGPIGGWIGDRVGFRPVLLSALVVGGLALICVPLVPAIPPLAAAVTVFTASNALVTAMVFSLLASGPAPCATTRSPGLLAIRSWFAAPPSSVS